MSLEDLYVREAEWKADLRSERRGDHHGLDLGDGRDTGVLEEMRVLTLLAWVSNHSSNVEGEQTDRGGGGIKEGRVGRILDQSVFDQLGEGGGSLNLGDSSVTSTGTWSEPVEGRGVSH